MKKRILGTLLTASVGFSFVTGAVSTFAQYPTAGITSVLNDEVFQARVGIAKILDTDVTTSDLVYDYIEDIISDEEKEQNYTIEVEIPELPELSVIEEEPAPTVQVPEPIIATGNRWNITLNDDEIYLLACITWLESGNQSDDGQQAVITVIFNRMASPLFPNGLKAVLSQKNPVQFTTWAKLSQAKPDEKVYRNIQAVLEGRGNNNVTKNGWLFFNGVGPSRATVIGDHKFWT